MEDNMKYAVDRIEGDIVILENLETKEKKEVQKSELPNTIKESNIVIESNNTYSISQEEENERLKLIQEKFNKIKS